MNVNPHEVVPCRGRSYFHAARQIDCPWCEIERLQGRLDASEEAAAAHHAEWRECEGVIVEQKAEIERLQAENESLKAQLDASYAGRWG